MPVVVNHDLPIDQDIINPRRIKHWLFISRAVLQLIVIEDYHVGPAAFLNQTTIGESHACGWPRSHFADRFFERDDVALAHVTRDKAREIAVTARMR